MSPVSRLTPSALALILALAVASAAQAEDWGFAYSGVLLEMVDSQRQLAKVDGSSNYVTNFYVRLYDDSDEKAASKTDALWARLITGVHVKDGNFTFEITDSGENVTELLPARFTRLQDAFANLSGDRMSVGVTPFDDVYDEITPRQQLVTAPYAVTAGDARGLRGDMHLKGTLSARYVKAGEVVFERGVTHEGLVTFELTPTLPSLAIGSDRFFAARSVETTNEFQTASLDAGLVETRDAIVTVRAADRIVATNLMVSGDVRAAALVAPAETNVLAIHGDVKTSEIKAARIVMDGSVRLFDFDSGVVTIVNDGGEGDWKWTLASGGIGGSWTVPSGAVNTHNVLVSLSLRVPSGGSATVTVGTHEVAKLGVSSVSGSTWIPFQTFLKPGETITWTCQFPIDNASVLLTCRTAKY